MRTVPETVMNLRKKIAAGDPHYPILVSREELIALLDDYERINSELTLAIEDDRGVL